MTNSRWIVNELEYLEAQGLSILVFHGIYPEGKQGGIEIIQHGERIATNGDLRLEPTPGQWAPLPKFVKREVDVEKWTVKATLSFADKGLNYTILLKADGDSIRVCVDLDKPLPTDMMGKMSFNLELFPPAYFGKTFHMGDTFSIFPRQANGPMKLNPDGSIKPVALATGSKLSIASEDPMRRMTIEQVSIGEMKLFDGRNTAHNGWFVLVSPVPSNVTKGAVEWLITPHSIPGWRRNPVISISQVGYHPDQVKHAIIELDPKTEVLGEGTIFRVDLDHGINKIYSAPVKKWGRFLRFEYAVFDFTHIREPGMYMVQYGSQRTPPFQISRDVFKNGVWQPTLETYFPVQMCHVGVKDRYQVWHGACHLDDALQAPPGRMHFDGYQQGLTTETPFSADQNIPYLDKGGWHDAGDDDLAAGSQAETTYVLALTRETFKIDTDQTTVRRNERLALLHTPDGVPDIIQQIVHGAENLLSGYRAAGHSFSGIISRTLEQYVHVGDWSTMTDNKIYDSSLGPNEIEGDRSGKKDDRWAFTSRDTALEYWVITALAAASRTLHRYEYALAKECLETAVKAWDYEQSHPPVQQRSSYVPHDREAREILATIELFITTKDERYRQHLIKLLPKITRNIDRVGWSIARVLAMVNNPNFTKSVTEAVKKHQIQIEEELAKNPYHILWHPHIWGIGWDILRFAMEQYYLYKAFPELISRENTLAVVNYILGCHPGSDISLVSGVGVRSLTIAYGINRADWSYIPGGVLSGTNLVRPDFPELKDNFPFLWQQAENVIGGSAIYIFCILAADELLNPR